MSRTVVVRRRQLRWSVADSARGIKTLRALWAEGEGVKEDPPRSTARSQSLEELKVGTAARASTAAAIEHT